MTIIRLDPSRRNGRAKALSHWARRSESSARKEERLDGTPSPYVPESSSLRDEVNKYFNYVCCFILLHELAHIILDHGPVKDPLKAQREELQADRWATQFMLDGLEDVESEPLLYTDRCTGVLVALAGLASIEYYCQSSRRTHSQIAERIFRAKEIMQANLKRLPPEKGDFPVYFAASILHSHLTNARIPLQGTGPYETADEFFLAVYIAVQKHK